MDKGSTTRDGAGGLVGNMYGSGYIEWEFLIFFSVRVRSADGLREGEGGKGYITFR